MPHIPPEIQKEDPMAYCKYLYREYLLECRNEIVLRTITRYGEYHFFFKFSIKNI